jgi:molybdenum cofactor synthesis domain-containing protein
MSSPVEIVSVNVSREKGTCKQPVAEITIDAQGVRGDAHAGPWHRQVSLLSEESIQRFARETGREVRPGDFAENITLRGIEMTKVAVLDRFCFPCGAGVPPATDGKVELEVTQLGKKCHGQGCAIFQQVGKCVMPSEGVFARVVSGGTLRPGDGGLHLPRTLRALIVTLSDRAAAGQYADRSGPRIRELLETFLADRRWQASTENVLIPDDAAQLRQRLVAAIASGADVIFTTGGTGIGARDITPETVAALCDKLLPGIMEHIRVKFGAEHPAALLSRSVAGVAGRTQLYALPGSVRAVEEYLSEILKSLEHAVFMLRGVDVHG